VIGAAIAVHKEMGPGLLESVYEECMCIELRELGIPFQSQTELQLTYKGEFIPSHLRLDLVVGDTLVVELKAVESVCPVHVAQLLTYLRATSSTLGLLVNFNVEKLTKGVRRVVLGFPGP
jgi:GxxExxY protein